MPIESVGEVVFQGGPAGSDGQSTYQAWLALGNVGSLADFLAAQKGEAGPANVLTIGAVSTGAPGSSASATITGQAPNQTLDLTVPRGATGAQPWQTPPISWAASTAYTAAAPASSVTYGGESYVCAASHTSGQAFDSTKWTKIAQKGDPGDPAVGAVSYAAVQTLTAAQRKQAKQNIAALGTGYGYLATDTSLTAADLGKNLLLQGGTTITLPASSSVGEGALLYLRGWNGNSTVKAAGSETFLYGAGANPSQLTLRAGQDLFLANTGGNWLVLGYAAPWGDTPSASVAQSFTDAQNLQLLTNLGILRPVAQCKLNFVNATTIRLDAQDGNQIFINGAYRAIPNPGPTLSNAGLSANTQYFIYATWSGSSVGIIASVSPRKTDPLYGHQVANTGGTDIDARQYTLVATVYTNASGQFQDDAAFRGVCSYYNQPPRQLLNAAATGSTGSNTPVELNGAARVTFVAFGGAMLDVETGGSMYNSTANQGEWVYPGLDGAAVGPGNYYQDSTANTPGPAGSRFCAPVTEGVHTATVMIKAGGGTATATAAVVGRIG